MNNRRKPQYLTTNGFTRQKPTRTDRHTGKLKDFPNRKDFQGPGISEESARLIAEALKGFLS